MTEDEELDRFENDLAQQMFHVFSDDIDSESGAKCEEKILVEMLALYPNMLKHKSLKQWVEENIGHCCLDDVKKRNEEILLKQNKKNNV